MRRWLIHFLFAKGWLTDFYYYYSAESVKNKTVSLVADLEILRVSLDCGTKDVLATLAFGRVGRVERVEAALALAVRRTGWVG